MQYILVKKVMVLTCTHNLCFEQKYEKYRNFSTENFHFLQLKKTLYIAWASFRNVHRVILKKKVQVGKDQEKAQSEKDSHSDPKTKVGKNQTNNQVLIP